MWREEMREKNRKRWEENICKTQRKEDETTDSPE